MQSNAASETGGGHDPSWRATLAHVALILANVAPILLTFGWFSHLDIDFGVTSLLFAWFWAMFSATAGIANHFGLSKSSGRFSFVVAPIFSAFWMLIALQRLNVL
jgi:hypothetical protein